MTKLLLTFYGIYAVICGLVLAPPSDAFVPLNNNGVIGRKLETSSSCLLMTILTHNGKKMDFKEGSSLQAACAKLGVKPKYSCKKWERWRSCVVNWIMEQICILILASRWNSTPRIISGATFSRIEFLLLTFYVFLHFYRGDCGSCTVSVGGSRIKACVGKVPPMPKLKSLQEKGLEVK